MLNKKLPVPFEINHEVESKKRLLLTMKFTERTLSSKAHEKPFRRIAPALVLKAVRAPQDSPASSLPREEQANGWEGGGLCAASHQRHRLDTWTRTYFFSASVSSS